MVHESHGTMGHLLIERTRVGAAVAIGVSAQAAFVAVEDGGFGRIVGITVPIPVLKRCQTEKHQAETCELTGWYPV